MRYCSQLCSSASEPLSGTAPNKKVVVLVPAAKNEWKLRDACIQRAEEFAQTIGNTFNRHNILSTYALPPGGQSSGPSLTAEPVAFLPDMACMGAPILIAVCTDGKKDPCCAKFGYDIFRTLVELSRRHEGVEVTQVNHLGGCRFAPTALVLPSGNLYGRITSSDCQQIINHERMRSYAPNIFRGNIFRSQSENILAALISHSLNLPIPLEQIVLVEDSPSAVAFLLPQITGRNIWRAEYQQQIFPLYSGCDNIKFERETTRSLLVLDQTLHTALANLPP